VFTTTNGDAPAARVIVRDFVAVCAVGVVESVTMKVMANAPETVGVPEIAPVEPFRASPEGSEPEFMDHA